MQRPGASATAPELRLEGTLTLYKGGTQTGQLRALTPVDRAALAVPRRPALAWQRVIATLSVSVPRMVGTAGSGQPRGTPAPANNPLAAFTAAAGTATPTATLVRASTSTRRTRRSHTSPLTYGAALALIAVGVLLWRRGGRRRSPRGP